MQILAASGLTILAVEPHIKSLPKALAKYGNIKLMDLPSALQGSSIISLLVDHSQFRAVDRSLLAKKQIFDTRGIWQ